MRHMAEAVGLEFEPESHSLHVLDARPAVPVELLDFVSSVDWIGA